MNYKIIHLGGKVLRIDSSVPDYIQTIDQYGRIIKVEHENGKIIYKSKAYQDLEFSEKYSEELVQFPTKWSKVEGSKFILIRSNMHMRYREPHYYPEYKCEKCDYIHSQQYIIKEHLRKTHQLYQKPPAPPPRCHACKYKYKVELKYNRYVGLVKEKEKHFC